MTRRGRHAVGAGAVVTGRGRRVITRTVAVVGGVLACGVLMVAASGAASAHPLGNFTVNRYSGIVVTTDGIRVDHVRDLAEIPTAQRRPTIDTSGDGVLSPDELGTWAGGQCRAAARGLRLTVGGQGARLAVTRSTAKALEGQAGLPTLRLECALRAPAALGSGSTLVRLADTGAGGEVGWKEMTAVGDGVTLADSSVPDRSRSGRLTSYPTDLLASPLDDTAARLEVRPGGTRLQPVAAPGAPTGVLTRGADALTLAFEGLAARTDGSPLAVLVAVLAAVALGAAHAVAPGHGKTVMAFYLSGRRDGGALRSAATVGATVTVTHTAAVLLIGAAVGAGTAFAPARLYPWLSLVSGLLVLAVGLTLLHSARHPHTHAPDGSHVHHHEPGDPHDHGHRDHDHDHLGHHDHAHDHGHPHDSPHLRAAVATLQRPRTATVPAAPVDHPAAPAGRPSTASPRGLVAMGLAGGLVPSPSALVVFLAAAGLGHPWVGVALVVAFGVGMACTLAVVGLLVVRLRDRAEARLRAGAGRAVGTALRLAPVATAAVVTLLGLSLAARGLAEAGLL